MLLLEGKGIDVPADFAGVGRLKLKLALRPFPVPDAPGTGVERLSVAVPLLLDLLTFAAPADRLVRDELRVTTLRKLLPLLDWWGWLLAQAPVACVVLVCLNDDGRGVAVLLRWVEFSRVLWNGSPVGLFTNEIVGEVSETSSALRSHI